MGNENYKILIVDDLPKNIMVLGNNLMNENYQIAYARSGSEAIELTEKNDFDLILLDIMMPGMDGYTICQNLKEIPEFYDVPVIFLTGKDKADDMGRSFKSGGDMFIKKPFSCERLLEIVNIVLMSTGKF